LLFIALVPVLLRIPRAWRYGIVVPSLAVSWAVAMIREGVPASFAQLFRQGPQLPWVITLKKTAEAYAPFLRDSAAAAGLTIGVYAVTGLLLWLLWRGSRSEISALR
jgi:hypothetical protein